MVYFKELKNFGGIFDYDSKSSRLNEVNKLLENSQVWQNPKQAQALGREKKNLEKVVNKLADLGNLLNDSKELFELAKEESDFPTLEMISLDVENINAK